MTLRNEVRWRAKIIAKIVLSRMPVPHAAWRRLGIFRHGAMRSGDYARGVFERALERAGLDDVRGLRLLELGPGDSLFSAVLAHSRGAASSIHVDVGRFADQDLEHYRQFASELEGSGYEAIDLSSLDDLDDLLAGCNATYLTDGLRSLRQVPSASVDFAWSQSMIEHVRLGELPEMTRELRRVMADDGVAVHGIDLRDHLADGLNSLRVQRDRWESDLMANSGFYTNRMRFSALCDLFERAGFRCEVVDYRRWETLPTPRERMTEEFRKLPESELLVRGFAVRLSPR